MHKNRWWLLNVLILTMPLLCAIGAWGQSPQPHMSLEYQYRGPFSHAPPSAPNSTTYNNYSYEAYRYGKSQEFQQYRDNLNGMSQSMVREAHQGSANITQLQQDLQRAQEIFDQQFPSLNPEVLSSANRELLNPTPQGSTTDTLQQQLNPVWDQVRAGSPVGTVQALASLQERINSVAGEDGRYLQNELRLSDITNSQGLLKAPYAQTPSWPLNSARGSFAGGDIRKGINQVLASESVFGAACAASGPATAQACAAASRQMQDSVAAYYMLDRLAARQGGFRDPATQDAFEELQAVSDFTFGVAQGVAQGTVSLAEGLAQLALSPIETAQAFGKALSNLPEVGRAIRKVAADAWADLSSGSAEARGVVVGRMTFEIASLVFPAGEVTKILGLNGVVKLAATEAVAVFLERTAVVSIPMQAVTARSALLAERLGIDAQEALTFSQRFLNAGDDAGHAALTFAEKAGGRERYNLLMSLDRELGSSVSEAAKAYVAKQVTYESTIVFGEAVFEKSTLVEIAQKFDRYDRAIKSGIPVGKFSEGFEVARGVYAEYKINQRIFRNTEADIFNLHGGGKYLSHRYSAPGEDMLYTAFGTRAEDAVLHEMVGASGKIEGPILLGRKTVFPQNVLDLTNPEVINRFGLSIEDLSIRAKTKFAYLDSQIIGSVARRNGFDAIIAPSNVPGAKNLGLLPK